MIRVLFNNHYLNDTLWINDLIFILVNYKIWLWNAIMQNLNFKQQLTQNNIPLKLIVHKQKASQFKKREENGIVMKWLNIAQLIFQMHFNMIRLMDRSFNYF